MHEERFIPHSRLRAQHGMSKPKWSGLTDVDAGCRSRQHAAQLFCQVGFALRIQQFLEFGIGVEVILDGTLGSAGDEHQPRGASCQCFLDCVLDQRLVHHRQHFLGAGLGGGQKPCAPPRYRKYSCPDLLDVGGSLHAPDLPQLPMIRRMVQD
jgi:hypothetical protein